MKGWFDMEKETNFEHYIDDIAKIMFEAAIEHDDKAILHALGKELRVGNPNKIKKWLLSPYKKKKYSLTNFEYDLIKVFAMYDNEATFEDLTELDDMKNQGYFECIPVDEPLSEILRNCDIK